MYHTHSFRLRTGHNRSTGPQLRWTQTKLLCRYLVRMQVTKTPGADDSSAGFSNDALPVESTARVKRTRASKATKEVAKIVTAEADSDVAPAVSSEGKVKRKRASTRVRTDPANDGAVEPVQMPSTSVRKHSSTPAESPTIVISTPLPRVLILHTGGTLGMDMASFEEDHLHVRLRSGAGGGSSYQGGLKPGSMLGNLLQVVPELQKLANLDLKVLFNKDSSNVGPKEWVEIAQALDANRNSYDAFLVVHGTDTMAYTASALSLMLRGFKRPIVMTGSQMPLSAPRSDARSNLLDSLQCATAAFSPPHPNFLEVAICFGGRLMRGNRCQKVNSSSYQAFDSLGYPYLATLGISVEWNDRYLLKVEGGYEPRFKLDPRVMRIPIVPGSDPRSVYGDLSSRGVKGVVLESFGVGNLPDETKLGWLPWIKEQRKKHVKMYLASQCITGPLQPALYKAGQLAADMGVEAGPQMTSECAIIKMMFCLAHPDIPLGVPIAGEM